MLLDKTNICFGLFTIIVCIQWTRLNHLMVNAFQMWAVIKGVPKPAQTTLCFCATVTWAMKLKVNSCKEKLLLHLEFRIFFAKNCAILLQMQQSKCVIKNSLVIEFGHRKYFHTVLLTQNVYSCLDIFTSLPEAIKMQSVQ